MTISRKLGTGLALVSMSISTVASAGSGVVVQPIQIGQETVRFTQGVATLDLRQRQGAVQIQSAGLDHGGLAFNIAVYNDGVMPVNIDIGNFRAIVGTVQTPVLTKDQLVNKAEKRAFWTQMAVAAVGGLAAGIAASQTTHYRSTTVSRRGVSRTYFSAPSVAGQFQAASITAGTGASVYQIQERLDRTREALGNDIVQMTTVNPGDSYAGRIVLQKISDKSLPQHIQLTVVWNGETYPFAFQMAKDGTPAPAFTNLTPAEPAAAAPRPIPARYTPPPVPVRIAEAEPYVPVMPMRRAAPSVPAVRPMVDPSLEIKVGR